MSVKQQLQFGFVRRTLKSVAKSVWISVSLTIFAIFARYQQNQERATASKSIVAAGFF